MIKVINITDIQNGEQALLCLRFEYLLLSRISLFGFLLLNDEYTLTGHFIRYTLLVGM